MLVASDPTLSPARRSWLPSANSPQGDFPLQNLPFGVFRRRDSLESPRVGVAIGDAILDVPACLAASLLDNAGHDAIHAARLCAAPSLNALMAAGRGPARALRSALSELLATEVEGHRQLTAQHALIAQRDAELFLPAAIGDYTDFYASVHHATNVGALFRPDSPLLPNYKWVPIGYHGRASSMVLSGASVQRPQGQCKGPNDAAPTMRPTRALDYELELAAFVGTGNELGHPIPLENAGEHLFGLSLLNDWSARDVQSWEYQPLGPFLAKNFASSLSAWVVTLDALAPFRAPLAARATDDPEPLPYLNDPNDRALGGFDITLEVWLRTASMCASNEAEVRLSRSNALDLYWTFGQMLAHHASNGCNLRAGDVLGSGTISGPGADSRGCLIELTRRGAEPVTLPNGETRAFLEDGDEVIMRAYAENGRAVRIGFGECRGVVR